MSDIDPDLLDDEEIPAQAVQGLNEATQRALNSGHPVVLVRDGQLVCIRGGEVEVLKEMPARRKITRS
jgi:hypothetical protein